MLLAVADREAQAALEQWPCGTITGIYAWLALGDPNDAVPMGIPDDDPNMG